MIDINNDIKFKTKVLKKWEKHKINWIEIITIINWWVFENIKWVLNEFESSVYYNGFIEAINDTFITIISIIDNNIVLNNININEKFWEYCRLNRDFWDKLFPWCWLENIDLYRSNKIEQNYSWIKYKFNFWFCWPNTNCRIHNKHDFIEIHTNIAWDWFMQKFEIKDEKTLVETVWLMPWNTHKRFDIKWILDENNNPKFPYHRWLWWKTWNIWLAIEKYI